MHSHMLASALQVQDVYQAGVYLWKCQGTSVSEVALFGAGYHAFLEWHGVNNTCAPACACSFNCPWRVQNTCPALLGHLCLPNCTGRWLQIAMFIVFALQLPSCAVREVVCRAALA